MRRLLNEEWRDFVEHLVHAKRELALAWSFVDGIDGATEESRTRIQQRHPGDRRRYRLEAASDWNADVASPRYVQEFWERIVSYRASQSVGNRVRRGPTLATSALATGSAINRSPSQSASMPRPDGMPFNAFEIRTGPNRRGTSRGPKLSEAQSTSGVLDRLSEPSRPE